MDGDRIRDLGFHRIDHQTRHRQPAGGLSLHEMTIAQQSPADRALKRSMSTWLAAGVDVTIATPWPIRRHDRSDFNDTIKEGGASCSSRQDRRSTGTVA